MVLSTVIEEKLNIAILSANDKLPSYSMVSERGAVVKVTDFHLCK